MTYLLDIVLILLGEIFLGHSIELKGLYELN